MEAIKTFNENGLVVELHYDENPQNPREWSNLGKMICSHRRYTLGDEQFDPDDYEGWKDLEKHLYENEGAGIVLPLGLYDHSGLSMYIGDSHDRWDGGQVGFIYATNEQLEKEYGVIGCEELEKVKKVLEGEVEEYTKYLNGEVYGFVVKNPATEEIVDSCWGYFDEEYAREEAVDAAKNYEWPNREKIHYGAFKELFKELDVNPYEFKQLSGDMVKGHFPNMSDRQAKINVKELAKVIWEGQNDV